MRVADRALTRQLMQGQAGQSFESREGLSGQQLQHALQKAAAAQQHWAPQGGSFLCRTSDGGSFLIGRDGNSQSGSFYSAGVYGANPQQPSHAPPPQQKDQRIEAMRLTMQVPTPMQGHGPTVATVYARPDPHMASKNGPQQGGAGTPTMPGTPLGSQGLQGLPPRQVSPLRLR